VKAVLEDWCTAPVSEKVRATLGFLEKVTLTPEEVSPEDILPMSAVGLNDQAIQEALYVCFMFNMIDRLADAFDFHLPSAKGYQQGGQILYRLGYGISSIPG
jgi:alkylhydroperoxidase family enzyme